MTLPTIHLNGSNASDMLDGLMEAMVTMRLAISHVGKVGPNGRDYYPQSPGAIHVAMDEHESRLERLRSVLKELEAIAQHVANHV